MDRIARAFSWLARGIKTLVPGVHCEERKVWSVFGFVPKSISSLDVITFGMKYLNTFARSGMQSISHYQLDQAN